MIYSYFSKHVYSKIYLEVVGKLEKLPGCLIQVARILYSKKINKSILRPTSYRNMEEIYRYPYELSNTINFFAQHFCVFFNKIFTHFLHVVPRFFFIADGTAQYSWNMGFKCTKSKEFLTICRVEAVDLYKICTD